VLATAVVQSAGEGRDDVGLADVRLDAQRARAAIGSIGAAPEPHGEPVVVASGSGTAEPQTTVQTSLDLSALDLRPGDELWLTALATDNYNMDGNRHEPVRSSVRKLRIIKEEELVEQVRAELSAVRKIAIRLDEEQADLRKSVQSGAPHGQTSGTSQASLSQRIVSAAPDRAAASPTASSATAWATTPSPACSRTSVPCCAAPGGGVRAGGLQDDAAARPTPEQDKTSLTPSRPSRSGSPRLVRDQLAAHSRRCSTAARLLVVGRNVQRILQQQRDLKARTARAGEKTMGQEGRGPHRPGAQRSPADRRAAAAPGRFRTPGHRPARSARPADAEGGHRPRPRA
jgi:hypothetical protein